MARLPVSRAEARMAALLRRLEQLLDDLASRRGRAILAWNSAEAAL